MTMIASGSNHFQVMCSGPSSTICPRFKGPTLSPAQVSQRESTTSNDTTTANEQSSSSLSNQAAESTTVSLAFVYGTLKRGFGSHWLMEGEIRSKHCRLMGIAQTKHKYPLVCGPFLLDVRGTWEHIRGELYQVDSHCLGLLDELERISKGHREMSSNSHRPRA